MICFEVLLAKSQIVFTLKSGRKNGAGGLFFVVFFFFLACAPTVTFTTTIDGIAVTCTAATPAVAASFSKAEAVGCRLLVGGGGPYRGALNPSMAAFFRQLRTVPFVFTIDV